MEAAAEKLAEIARAEVRRRIAEFIDIEKQVLVRLLGQNSEPLQELTEPVIVLAKELMTSGPADFTPRTVFAFATESGGNTSHKAVLANALEIPAIVGLGRFLSDVSGGDTVIIDGEEGSFIIDPNEATVSRYEEAHRDPLAGRIATRGCDKPAATLEGMHIHLLGDIELAQEAPAGLSQSGRGGVEPLSHRVPLP